MKRTFTLLFASLFLCVGMMKAEYHVIESVGDNVTDLSTLAEDSYVALYNVGKSKYIYEGGDYKLYMGTAAEVGAGHEYIWQVHKEGEKFLFTSASGRYFSTPLDGKDVFTVSSDNAAKDQFTISAHSEDNSKWIVKSSNANIYWDAQNDRFVGWAGNGANSQYEIRPVTVTAAAENDFNKLITTDESAIQWYTVKNVRKGKYAAYAGDAITMTQEESVSAISFFYFTGRATAESATVGIHNLVAGDKLCADYNSWTAAGREWLITKQATGLSIAYPGNANKAWNDASGGGKKIEYWSANDPGSAWQIEIVTDFAGHLTAAKAAAILAIEKLSGVSAIYANVAEQFKAEIEGVTENSAQSLLAVYNILENYRKSIDGKSMKFRVDGRGGRFLGYNKGNDRIETQILDFDDAYWTLKYAGNGYFKLYNPAHKLWLGAPDGKLDEKKLEDDTVEKSYRTIGLANEDAASYYKFEVTEGGNTVLLVADNAKIAHAANDHHIMHYDLATDNASWWAITDLATFPMTYDEYKEFLAEKSALVSELAGYAKQLQDDYGLVKSGDKVAVVVNHPGTLGTDDCQPSSNLLDGNNATYVHSAYSGDDPNVTHHYIEVELSEATQNILCYFSKRNNSNRPSVVKVLAGNSTDALAEVATLAMPESTDGNVQSYFSEGIDLGAAYTHLRFVVTHTNTATKFFTLSEFYVLPVNDATAGIAALAGASILDTDLEARLTAADNSLKTLQLPETLAEVKAALDANVSNHADEPQLGQYTTAAYNELKSAYEACSTIDQLDAVFEAFAAFEAAKNVPVYFITSKHDGYAAGSAIYYDGAWKWKNANIYDRQMWMVIPGYVQANVPVVDAYDANGTSYQISDYLTGTVMRGKSVQIVKIADWEGAYNLQYNADATSRDAAQHAKDNGELVSWMPATTADSQASAWGVEYIGNSYDLKKLTDGHIAALTGLQAAYDAKAYVADAEIGEGLGRYTGDKSAIVAALNAGKVILDNTLSQKAGLTVDAINAAAAAINEATGLAINLPEEGKYYRFYGACQASLPGYYITGNTNSDGGRIACTAEEDASTIFYYADGKLKAYESGKYIGLSATHWTFADSTNVDAIKPASVITFAASPRTAGVYTIKSADRYLHYTVYGNAVEIGRCEVDTHAEHDWYIIEVSLENLPTGIERPAVADAAPVIYDLAGRRVEKAVKGIYIVNGKKVVIK